MSEEIYPMPSFVHLIVSDLQASSRFYQEALGFIHIFTMPGPGGAPALVHLRWTKYADLLIASPRDGKILPEPRGVGVSINFTLVDRFSGNIDALARQARDYGANVTGPVSQPWNVRELTVLDPDGYRLVFTVPIDRNMSLEAVLDQTRRSEA